MGLEELRLVSDMITLCRRMSVISEVPAAQLGGVRTKHDSRAPTGSSKTMGEIWWDYFKSAPDYGERERVYMRAEIALAQAQGNSKRRPSAMTTEERDAWILSAYEGQSAEFVALAEGISYNSVRRVRRLAGRQPKDGCVRSPT